MLFFLLNTENIRLPGAENVKTKHQSIYDGNEAMCLAPWRMRLFCMQFIILIIDIVVYGLIQLFKTSLLQPIWMEFFEGSVSYQVKSLTAKAIN